MAFNTAIAAIRWFVEFLAGDRFKVLAESIAHGAAFATFIMPVGMTDGADMVFVTSKPMSTGVIV